MLYVVLLFLFLSVLFYLAFGGADFGVGIIELFSSRKNKKVTKKTAYRIIGPVWEANHIWLIICIVIMWIAFPLYYNLIVTQLHIPLTLMLVGIIGRGTAFAFRHYDAFRDESQIVYDVIFEVASLFTPFFVGVTAGALISGAMIHPDYVADQNFYSLYVAPWFNSFALLVGVFVASLDAFISSVYLVGETEGKLRKYYLTKAKKANWVVVIAGVLLFVEALFSSRQFADLFFENILTLLSFIIVTALLWPLWHSIRKGLKNTPRLILGVQLFLMLFVWSALAFPYLIFFESGKLSMLEQLPPDSVFNTLGWALLIAAVFVLPGLFHLFRTFGLLTKN